MPTYAHAHVHTHKIHTGSHAHTHSCMQHSHAYILHMCRHMGTTLTQAYTNMLSKHPDTHHTHTHMYILTCIHAHMHIDPHTDTVTHIGAQNSDQKILEKLNICLLKTLGIFKFKGEQRRKKRKINTRRMA